MKKKRILGLMTALSLTLTSVVPTWADSTTKAAESQPQIVMTEKKEEMPSVISQSAADTEDGTGKADIDHEPLSSEDLVKDGQINTYNSESESYDEIDEDNPVDVSILDGKERIYTFTPKKTGYYMFYSKDEEQDTRVYLYDTSMNEIGRDDDSGSGRNFQLVKWLEAGEQYYVQAGIYNSSEASYTMYIDYLKIEDLKLDKQVTCEAVGYYSFVPEQTCVYKITRNGTSKSDAVQIYAGNSEDGDRVSSTGTSAIGVCVTEYCYLVKGKTYHIQVKDSVEHALCISRIEGQKLPDGVSSAGAIADGDMKLYEFVPEKTGMYEVSLDSAIGFSYRVLNDRYERISDNYLSDMFMFAKGKTYYLEVDSGYAYGEDVYEYEILLQHKLPQEYKDGTVVTAGAATYYEFIPEKTCYYEFYSTSTDKTNDPKIYIYDEYFESITSDDDDGEDYNYMVRVRMKKGKSYFIRLNDNDEEATCKIHVEAMPCVQLETDKVHTASISGSAVQYYVFVPDKTDLYKITMNSPDIYMSARIYKDGSAESLNRFSGSGEFNRLCWMEEDTAYYIEASGESRDTVSYTFQISDCDAQNIQLGTALNVDVTGQSVKYFKFVPDQTGYYDIDSINCKEGDPNGFLYNEFGSVLDSDNDYGMDDNFYMSEELTAGKLYFIQTGGYREEHSVFDVVVEKTVQFEEMLPSAVEVQMDEDKMFSDTVTAGAVKNNRHYYDRFVKIEVKETGNYSLHLGTTERQLLDNSFGLMKADKTFIWDYSANYKETEGVYKKSINVYLEKGVYYLGLEFATYLDASMQIQVERKPDIVDIKVEPVSAGATLVYREGGSWRYGNNSAGEYGKYYSFYMENILKLFKISYIYSDGSVVEGSIPNGVQFETNQSRMNPWTSTSTNNILKIKTLKVEKEVNVPVAPPIKVTSIDFTLAKKDTVLIYGQNGYTDRYYDEENDTTVSYFVFDKNVIINSCKVVLHFEDGSEQKGSLKEMLDRIDLTYEINQSKEHVWMPDGKDNTVTISIDGVEASLNMPVKYFLDIYDECPEIEANTEKEINYTGVATSGAILFKPTEDGTYYFYAKGDTDTYATLYDEEGNTISGDDDDFDGVNFLITRELTAGKTYVLVTRTYGYYSEIYKVGVSKTEPALDDEGYATLEGMDLSGKYINLSFVVDTTGSMSDEINSVRDCLKDFVDSIAKTGATLRISLIDYKDITADGLDSTVLHYAPSLSIWHENSDLDELKAKISKLDVTGGGDGPESVVDALANVADPSIMKFNASAAKFVFLLTDADYKEENTHGIADMDELIEKLKEENIATTVITEKGYYSDYSQLVGETGGTMININGDFAKSMGRFAARVAKSTADYTPDTSVVQVERISLGDDLTIPEGRVRNFTPVIAPTNATDKRVEWEVEDTTVARISEELTTDDVLVIQGIKEGVTKVIARSKDGGYTAYFDLKVEKTVSTDSTFESCDIDELLGELDKEDSETTDYIFYSDYAEDGLLKVDGENQKKIFDKIKELSKKIFFVNNDEYGELKFSWEFKGKDITNSAIEVDFHIDIDAASSEAAKAAAREGMKEYASFDFSHTGDLPGLTTIKAKTSGLTDGNYTLYHYDEKGMLLPCGLATVKDGVAEFKISHCSSYVIEKKPDVEVYGDVTGDGKVRLEDAQKVLRAALLLTELGKEEQAAADVTGDGNVKLEDAQQILRKALLLLEKFDVEKE